MILLVVVEDVVLEVVDVEPKKVYRMKKISKSEISKTMNPRDVVNLLVLVVNVVVEMVDVESR